MGFERVYSSLRSFQNCHSDLFMCGSCYYFAIESYHHVLIYHHALFNVFIVFMFFPFPSSLSRFDQYNTTIALILAMAMGVCVIQGAMVWRAWHMSYKAAIDDFYKKYEAANKDQ